MTLFFFKDFKNSNFWDDQGKHHFFPSATAGLPRADVLTGPEVANKSNK